MARVDGTKPVTPVATGSASIPPPIQVPPIKKMTLIIDFHAGKIGPSASTLDTFTLLLYFQ
jgi:hypothetical protein